MAFQFTKEMQSVVLHTVAATALGILSIQVDKTFAFILGAIFLSLLNLVVKFLLKKKETSWWLANGVWPFMITWLAIWTIAMNIS